MSDTSAADKTLLVLDAALTNSRFTDVVDVTGLAKATVHRITSTLVSHGFVALADDGTYLPGPKALSLAGAALERIDISALAAPIIADLVAATGCTVHVGALNGDEVIYVARRDSDKPYRMPSRVGKAIALHSTGIGKAILATFDPAEFDRIVGHAGLPARTPNTITGKARLSREIAAVRKRGYAIDNEENEPGIRCVAAGIKDHTGQTNFGISISTLTLEHTVDQVAAMAPQAIEAAARISRALGHRNDAAN
ncbi:IclR family transcriptional regulator [Spelaeicoccus albus]|uniref:DNA-binding IclR family transcriptional regulator n=1 Tax=Spelaeicoccus albus TaxID=1280376 RepID=A0A7Z0ACG3_9MICO|nr:IclR family transcriptional regulator [Spelaeicoccus albus]NYI66666.1 DNA-binding IclR family transcriptional regulator [Spelaeicoccus albus]